MARCRAVVALAALAGVLQGCALANLGAEKPAPRTFDLVAPVVAEAGLKAPLQVVVAEPTAVRALAGDNILVKPTPADVTYYADAVWSDNLPRLLQARLIETLEDSGRFRAVGNGQERIEGDLEMMTHVRAFQVDMAGSGGTARVDLFVKLIDPSSGRLAASRGFEASVDVRSGEPEAGVAALNAAAGDVLPKVAGWAAKVGARLAAEREATPADESGVRTGTLAPTPPSAPG